MEAEPAVETEPEAVKEEGANGVLPPGTVGPRVEHAADLTRGRDETYLARITSPGAVVASTHTNIAPPPESATAGAAAGIATQELGCGTAAASACRDCLSMEVAVRQLCMPVTFCITTEAEEK